jgi:hypothetical protein
MLRSILKQSDNVGIRPEITFKGKSNHQTDLGGALTVLLFILTLIGIIFLGQDIFKKKNPMIFTGNDYIAIPPPLQLNPNVFPFYFAIEDPTNSLNYFIDDSIYTIKAQFISQSRSVGSDGNVILQKNSSLLALKVCEISDFLGYEEIFSPLDYKNAFCLAPGQNVTIRGAFPNSIFNSFRISIYACNNATSKVPCRSQSIIDSKLKSSFLAFQYGDFFANPSNYSFPMTKVLGDYSVPFSNYYQKKISAQIKRTIFKTDEGFLSEVYNNEFFYQIDGYPKENFQPFLPSTTDFLIQFTLKMSYSEEINHRSYIKLQTIVAQIGGLFNFLYLFFQYFVSFMTKRLFILEVLGNQGFVENKNNPITKDSQIMINNLFPKENELNSTKEVKEVKEKKFNLKISKNDILFSKKYLFCSSLRNKAESEKFKNISEFIKKKLDINSIFALNFETSKIKRVLFDKDQLDMFNSVNTNLSLELDEESEKIKKSQKEMKNIYSSVSSSNNDAFSNKLSKRLINLYE